MLPRCAGLWLLTLVGCDLVYGLDGRECERGAPFSAGTPVQIGDLGYSVEGARFSPDQQAAYLSLCTIGQTKKTCELWRARYFADEQRFAELFQLAELDADNAYDAYPTVTADGKHFLWSSDRNDHLDVYVATESNGRFPADNVRRLAAADGLASNEPYVLDDNETVYFGGLATGETDNWDLFRSHGPGPDFGARELVTSLNSGVDDAAPVVSNDELEVFFASRRSSTDSHDIFTATRDRASAPFGAPTKIEALSTPSPGIDWPLWLSPDRCKLYYINKDSDDDGATARLFVTSRQ